MWLWQVEAAGSSHADTQANQNNPTKLNWDNRGVMQYGVNLSSIRRCMIPVSILSKWTPENYRYRERERECLATCRAYRFLFAPKTAWLYRQLSPMKLLATRDTESVRNLEVSASKSHEKGRKPCQVLLQKSTILKWHKEASFHQIVYLQFCGYVFHLVIIYQFERAEAFIKWGPVRWRDSNARHPVHTEIPLHGMDRVRLHMFF